jgi:NADP-dependent 3-hydroxy acid dehydrogenase YdfG
MPRKLRDSVIVIIGASSGIGRATALKMAHAGATVVVAARSEEPLRQVASECAKLSCRSPIIDPHKNCYAAVRS